MDVKITAVVGRAQDYRDFDKKLQLITPEGIIRATMRGVRRKDAKLKTGAMPFAFCEYTASKNGENYTVTGCTVIEDFFAVTTSAETLVAGSIILETALCGFIENCAPLFVFMLHRLKDLTAGAEPNISAARFIQYVIHSSGYQYTYKLPPEILSSSIELLAYINTLDTNALPKEIDKDLGLKTLLKLIENFEGKFNCTIKSKKLLTALSDNTANGVLPDLR